MVKKKLASPQAIAARFGRTRDEIASLADRHTCAVQLWLTTRAPQAARFEGVGVRAGSSGRAISLLNQAWCVNCEAGVDDETVADEIEAVKAFFARRGVPWYWWLGPTASPPDMARRLERHGLKFDRPPLPALVAPLPVPDVPLNPDVHVWQASDRADLRAASTIRHVAFRFPAGEALDYFEAMPHDWLGQESLEKSDAGAARLYLARLGDGPPAAISAMIMGDGLPGVYVMATLPEFRRRGLGKALLSRILADAIADGHCLIVLTASDLGYPLYRQFGFEHIFDYVIYRP